MSTPVRDGASRLRSLTHAPVRARLRLRAMRLAWQLDRALDCDVVKRTIDIAASAAGLVFAFPVFAAIALLIKADDGGPVLYWQPRVGRFGRVFRFPKFRTMCQNADDIRRFLASQNVHGEGVTFKIKDDPRVTRVGRYLRRFSLDELPQLWCVLKGEMSLVGPRPPVPSEVARYAVAERRRLEALPGLTCIWQVSGRADVPFARQVQMDVDYIERRSLRLDLELLAKTVPAALTGRGAY